MRGPSLGRHRWILTVAVLISALISPKSVDAQSDELDTQLFMPSPSPGTTFTIDRPQVPRHLSYVLGLNANAATGVFNRSGDDDAVVPWRFDAELLASLGLFEWLELGFAAGVVVSEAAEDPFQPDLQRSTKLTMGDIRLMLKVPILRGDVALATRLTVSLPTGDGDRFVGTDYWTTAPELLFAWKIGILTIGANAAWRFRRQVVVGAFEWDDELHLGLGANVAVHSRVALIAEGQVRLGFAGNSFDRDENPGEADLGARLTLANGFTADVGVGTGFLSGWGSPSFRGFLVLRYASEREPCAAGPEDFDGFEDGDFCADLDNDGDGLEDENDRCPNDPEDIDQFLDTDGCPDTDNDADGVVDGDDQCPIESEDRDGFQDEDGCPETDNDEDGVLDGADQCPNEPEDRDSYQDDDGCPEPGPEAAVVTVTDTRILISERIYFDFDTDVIRSVSLPLLDQVAEVIGNLPSGRRIRVDGYTDDQGNPQYNLDLSYRRARSVVEYLTGRGVARDRIDYVGYGSQNPVAPNDSPEGRALNRRVEFTILEPGERARRRP
ncbi:MAG: OmpA family protein [Myxococcota bacterium]